MKTWRKNDVLQRVDQCVISCAAPHPQSPLDANCTCFYKPRCGADLPNIRIVDFSKEAQHGFVFGPEHADHCSITSFLTAACCLPPRLITHTWPVSGPEPQIPHRTMRKTLRDMPATIEAPRPLKFRRPEGCLNHEFRDSFLAKLENLKTKCQRLAAFGCVMLEILRGERRVPAVSGDRHGTSAVIQLEPQGARGAKERVLNTPELLELILNQLNLSDLLLGASLTCLGFKRSIDSSWMINRRLEYYIVDAAFDARPPGMTWICRNIEINYVNQPPNPSLHIWFDRVSMDRFISSPSFRKVLMPKKSVRYCFFWTGPDSLAQRIRIPESTANRYESTIVDDLLWIREQFYTPPALRSMCWFIR